MNIIFRKINPDSVSDLDAYCELMNQLAGAAAEDRNLMASKIREYNSREDGWLMVAEDADSKEICGSLLAITFGDFIRSCRPILLVEHVVTSEKYRRKGVARAMFSEIESWGKGRNAAYVLLVSEAQRTGAHAFYREIGYTEAKGFKKIFD